MIPSIPVRLRAASRLLAEASSSSSSSSSASIDAQVRRAAASLLPPLPLYRRLLRSHRLALSPEMRSMGDAYVKDEFRRHRDIDNPLQIVGFLAEWKRYLDHLEVGKLGLKFEGRRMDPDQFDKFNEQQLYQLYDVFQATSELFDPEKAQAQPPGGNRAVGDAVEEALSRARAGRNEAADGSSGGDASGGSSDGESGDGDAPPSDKRRGSSSSSGDSP